MEHDRVLFLPFSNQLIKDSKWALASGVQLQCHPTPVRDHSSIRTVSLIPACRCYQVVESAALASVRLPDLSYTPCIPTDVFNDGKVCAFPKRSFFLLMLISGLTQLSEVQAEAVLCACQRFTEWLPDGR
jgi:hypothetical protein